MLEAAVVIPGRLSPSMPSSRASAPSAIRITAPRWPGCGRRQPPAAGRGVPGPPRSALLGRAGGVPKARFCRAYASPWRADGDAHPGRRNVTFPGAVHARGGQQPVSLRDLATRRECTCTVPQIRGYQNRIGGPLIDRIDSPIWMSAASVRRRFWSGRRGTSPRSCGRG